MANESSGFFEFSNNLAQNREEVLSNFDQLISGLRAKTAELESIGGSSQFLSGMTGQISEFGVRLVSEIDAIAERFRSALSNVGSGGTLNLSSLSGGNFTEQARVSLESQINALRASTATQAASNPEAASVLNKALADATNAARTTVANYAREIENFTRSAASAGAVSGFGEPLSPRAVSGIGTGSLTQIDQLVASLKVAATSAAATVAADVTSPPPAPAAEAGPKLGEKVEASSEVLEAKAKAKEAREPKETGLSESENKLKGSHEQTLTTEQGLREASERLAEVRRRLSTATGGAAGSGETPTDVKSLLEQNKQLQAQLEEARSRLGLNDTVTGSNPPRPTSFSDRLEERIGQGSGATANLLPTLQQQRLDKLFTNSEEHGPQLNAQAAAKELQADAQRIRDELAKLESLRTQQENAQRFQTVTGQIGSGTAFENRSRSIALSPTEGLVRLSGAGGPAGGLVTEAAEVRKALATLSDEMSVAARATQRATKTIGQAFEDGFFGVGGSKYRGGAKEAPNPLIGVAETGGIVAKYALEGTIIFKLGQALHEVVNNYAEMSEAQEQINSMFDEGTKISDGYVNSLQNVARTAGESVVEALRTARIGIAAFSSGETEDAAGNIHPGDSLARREQVGLSFNQSSVQLAQITGRKLSEAAESSVAIGTSFQLPVEQLNRVNNAVAVAGQVFGANRAEVVEGLRTIATVGQAAGFSLEELAQVVGVVQQKTAESGGIIASSLARIFSLVQGNPGQSLLNRLGVDTTKSTRDQIMAVAERYTKPESEGGLTQRQREEVNTTFGGERSMKELIPLLGNATELQAAFSKAITDTSAAQRQQDAVINSIVGQLKIFSQTLKNIGLDLARSGLATPFGILLKTLEPILDVTDRLLQQWVKMPGPLKEIGSLLLEAGLAWKLLNTEMGASLLRSTVGIFGFGRGAAVAGAGGAAAAEGRFAEAGRLASQGKTDEALVAFMAALQGATVATTELTTAEQLATGTTGELAAAEEAAAVTAGERAGADILAGGGEVARLGRLGSLGRLGAGAGALAGGALTVGTLAGVVGLIGTVDQLIKLHDTSKQSNQAIGQLSSATSSGDFLSVAQSLAGMNEKLKSQSGGIFGTIANGLSGGAYTREAKLDKSYSDFAAEAAKQILAEEKKQTTAGVGKGFFGGDLADGLANMSAQGYSATAQIDALAASLGLLGQHAQATSGALGTGTPAGVTADKTTSNTLAANLTAAARAELLNKNKDISGYTDTGYGVSPNVTLAKDLAGKVDPKKLNETVQAAYKHLGKGAEDVLTDKDKAYITNQLVASIDVEGLSAGTKKSVLAVMRTAVTNSFGKLDKNAQQNSPNAPITADELASDLGLSIDGSKPKGSLLATFAAFKPDALDLSGGEATQREMVDELLNLVKRARASGQSDTSPALAAAISALHTQEDQLITTEIANAERLRKAAQSRTTDPAKIKQIGENALKAEIADAISSVPQLVSILDNANQQEINLFTAVYKRNAALAAANAAGAAAAAAAAAAVAAADQANADSNSAGIGGGVGATAATAQSNADAAKAKADAAKKKADKALADANNIKVAGANAAAPATGGSYANGDGAAAQGVSDANAARLAKIALEARPGDDVSAAATALKVARQKLSDAKGSGKQADIYAAQKEVNDAIYALAQAKAGFAQSEAQASAIPGDALSAARAGVRSARDQLSADASNSTKWWADYKTLQDAKYQLSQTEMEQANNKALLKIDLTDPVAVAKAAKAASDRKLAFDKGRGADTTADQLEDKRSQTSVEAAQFDQRFHDAQIADELGRISHTQYMKYLNNEHDRLTAVHNKSRQQIDELNQIDQAIKASNDNLTGQFNLGDIKVPTPYEVRRSIQTGATTNAASYLDNRTVNITVNGADIQKVESLFSKHLGNTATNRVTVSPKKGT